MLLKLTHTNIYFFCIFVTNNTTNDLLRTYMGYISIDVTYHE